MRHRAVEVGNRHECVATIGVDGDVTLVGNGEGAADHWRARDARDRIAGDGQRIAFGIGRVEEQISSGAIGYSQRDFFINGV